MLVSELINAMESIAPTRAAESWDKVGLQIGVESRELTGPIMLTIDLTEAVLEEAIAQGVGAIVAYHPVIFSPLDALGESSHTERIVRRAVEEKIAVYVPHTALDAARDGVTDWLCEGLSAETGKATPGVIAGDCRAITPASGGDPEREVKVITFAPADSVDGIRGALGTAGAGGIGKYRLCSFTTQGQGTFLPTGGTNPTIGSPGQLERVDEQRLEMVCSRKALPLVIETLKQFHPYEEPAFDIVELVPEPLRRTGSGRRLVLDRPVTIQELGERLRAHLGRVRIRYALAGEDRPFTTIGVVPGSGGSLVQEARAAGCEVFVTGEMTHHTIQAARQAGVSVLLAGHTNTERGYLARLREKLLTLLGSSADIRLSREDDDHIVAVGP